MSFSEWASYAAAYLFAGFTVLMFGINEFSKPALSVSGDAKSVIAQAMPNELTSEKDFLQAWVIYIFGLIAIFVLLSLSMQRGVTAFASGLPKGDIPPEAWPILSAFCLVGFMPNMPMLKQLEQWWRDLMHRSASIPSAVNVIVDELSFRAFAYDFLPPQTLNHIVAFDGSAARLEALKKALGDRSLSNAAENWVLASGIINTLLLIRPGSAATRQLGTRFIGRHTEHFNAMLFDYRDLKEKITAGKPSIPIGKFNDQCDIYQERVADLLYKLKVFVACIIVARPAATSREQAISLLSFTSPNEVVARNKNKDEQDTLILSFGMGPLVAFACAASFPALGPLLGTSQLAGWPTMENYSQNLFAWFITDALRYPIIVFIALLYRHHLILQGRWFFEGRARARELDYAKLFLFVLALSVIVDLCARFLNFYVITRGPNADRTILECVRGYFNFYWLSSVISAVFAMTIVISFDELYRKKIAFFSLPVLMFLGVLVMLVGVNGYNVYAGGLAQEYRLLGAWLSYAMIAISFFLLVVVMIRIRMVRQFQQSLAGREGELQVQWVSAV